jgi:hypothetical protein
MSWKLRALVPALAAASILLPVAAQSASGSNLWATINICDTKKHPNVMGVRASMPGNGTSQKMFMRFRATYYDEVQKKWFNVAGDSLSPWVYAGSATYKTRQAGWNFQFDRPAEGQRYVVRGVVYFRWRKRNSKGKWVTVRRERRVTVSGHKYTRDADPRDYSNGRCVIKH